eukprot:scaffold2263_cov76-Skeletonema_dohrnii-CCMP3373.AAC.2
MPSHTCCRSFLSFASFGCWNQTHLLIMNTSTSTTTTTCPLAKENGTEIISPTGSELTSISLDVEQANNDASAVDASPKAKTMKEVLWRYGYGRGLAVSVVIALALAGKAFLSRAHNDPLGTDDMMMNANLNIDSSKQVAVALLELEGDGNNAAGYDLTKVDGGVSTVRTLEQGQDPIIYEFTKVGNGKCTDSNNNEFVVFWFHGSLHVDECKTQCGECPGQGQAAGRELRGFFYWYGNCYCLLDDGGLFDKSVCTGASYAFSGSGTGAICKVDPLGWGSAECWKVVDSNLQCPTPAPTNEPTSSPSMSPTQSPSTAPTAPPSMAPTASPTAPPSMAPTASPTAPPSIAPTASPTAPPSMAPTETPTKNPTALPTVQPTSASAPTNANTKSGKVAKVAKANGIVDLQVQEMKSGGSSVSISPHVVRGEMRGGVELGLG